MTKISLVVYVYSEVTPNTNMICAMLGARYGFQALSALANQALGFYFILTLSRGVMSLPSFNSIGNYHR